MRRLPWSLVLMFCIAACRNDYAGHTQTRNAQLAAPSGRTLRIATAKDLTRLYAASELRDWKLKASAAGPDCGVLIVETPVAMERTMIDAMHHAVGSYRISDTSIDELAHERGFRGVLYKEGSGRLWPHGNVGEGTPAPCH